MTGDTMAGRSYLKAAWAVLAAAALVASTPDARAQNYDGDTIIRFGMFGQAAFQNYGITLPAPGSASTAGFAGGFSAGLDFHPHPAWLIGVEIDASVGEGRATFNGIGYGYDYLATLRGRFGVYPNQDWLLYGTAGLAYLGYEAQNHATGVKASETVPGALVGVGAEYKWRNLVVFGEYDYATFATREFSFGTVRQQIDSDAHLLRFGVKFNVGHDFGRLYHPD